MRSPAGMALIAAGAFLAGLALLLPGYVVRALTAAPADLRTTFLIRADDATVLDSAYGRLHRGVEVEAISALEGDADAASGDTVVWNNATLLRKGDLTLGYTERRSAFDRFSGESVNCCEAHVGDLSVVRQAGLAFKWPAFTQPRAYPFFDTVTRSALPMEYGGSEEIDGLLVYRFVQQVPETRTEAVPGGVADTKGRRRPAHTRVELERTFWVEPVTGTPVRLAERRRHTIVTDDGALRQLSLEADLVSAPEEVAGRVAEVRDKVGVLRLLDRPELRWSLTGAGVLAIGLGVVLALRRRRPVR
ncbi:DUF3068 domain-containing protein [Nonomuraea sp. NPDC050328]|uniref:DUF3068 domain-containing protein n=1 Tax=Nonomuraea sp. NPDC050328 TaxID=3364361 RepID=UPI0037B675BE